MSDLKNPKWMYLKAFLFLLIIVVAGVLLYLQSPTSTTVALILLLIWASARLYYFIFYVLEKYVNPDFKYAGLWALVKEMGKKRS